jgi:hypothetical protein
MTAALAERPFVERPFVDRPFVERPFVERPFVERPFVDSPFSDVRASLTLMTATPGAFVQAAALDNSREATNSARRAMPTLTARYVRDNTNYRQEITR